MTRFHEFRQTLALRMETWPGVEGLVWAGSTADTARADEWSDLDFFLVVQAGQQEAFRSELGWLPDAHRIAWHARETEHGLKVVYDDALVLEFAVFSREELSVARLNHHALAFGDDDLARRIAAIYYPVAPTDSRSLDDHLGLVYALLLIGLGRHLRGEQLAGGQFVRSFAVAHLLAAGRLAFASGQPAASDALDPWRRFELEFPQLGVEISSAIATDVPAAAETLSRLVVGRFGDKSQVPAKAHAVLAQRFGWSS